MSNSVVHLKNQILADLFKSDKLNEMLRKFDAGAGNDDLKSELFLVLCNQPESKIIELKDKNQLMFFCTGIVQRMVFQKGSKFHRTYRKHSVEFNENDEQELEQYDVEKDKLLDRVEQGLENDLHWVERSMISLYLSKGSMTKISQDVKLPVVQVRKIMKAARTKIDNAINGKINGNYIVATMDIVLDVNDKVTPENVNEILEEVWEYVNYRVNGNKVPSNSNDTFLKEIKPLKIKKIV